MGPEGSNLAFDIALHYKPLVLGIIILRPSSTILTTSNE
jgi:hypothetical protein